MAQKFVSLATSATQLAIREGTPRLVTFLKYARVELKPPGLADIPEIRQGFRKLASGFRSGSWKHLTVKEAWLNTLVAIEVGCWFFIGETIGRRKLCGYYVPP